MGQYFDNVNDDPLVSNDVNTSIVAWDQGIEEEDEMFTQTVHEYSRLRRMKYVFVAACLVFIIGAISVSVTIGSYDIGFLKVYELIWAHITNSVTPEDATADYVVWELRLPRIITAIFGGAALAVAGAVMQSALKNPLADSYTTGVASGAGFGAVVAMTFGIVFGSMSSVVIFAFLFALIPIGIIIAISRFTSSSPTTMIMAGMGTMYIFNAMTTVIMLYADPQALKTMYAWQVGSLGLSDWSYVPMIVLVSSIGVFISCLMGGKLNVLATGDESAKALGINADKLRILLLLLTGILAAGIVSFIGLVGFVGLVAPHICRMFIGADNKFLLPASAIFGSVLMLLADQIGMVMLATPLPVGVVMAFFGGPLFIWLILRRSSKAW
jgi:iron complex transport system permease protein